MTVIKGENMRTIKLLGVIALAAIIGFTMVACPHVEERWSEPQPQPLTAPTNLQINGTTLTWSWVTGAMSYTVNIDGSTYFAGTNSYSLSDLYLPTPGTYTLRVRANGNGYPYIDSAWSVAIQYTIGTNQPQLQQLDTPVNVQISGTNVTWDTVSGAISYNVWIFGWPMDEQHPADTNSYSLTYLTEPQTYTIKVRANGDYVNNSHSEWSEPVQYTVEGTDHTHEWGEWKVTTPADCETDGMETRVCALDAMHTELRTIGVLGHEWGEWIVTIPATEIEDGVETRTCAHNSEHTQARATAALGHTHEWGEWSVTTPATCTREGEETRICSLNALHFETRSVAVNPNAHQWGEWTVTTPATCTTEGVETRTCTHDAEHKETRSTPIDSDAHDWGEWIVTVAPVWLASEGSERRTCSHNALHSETRTIPIPTTLQEKLQWLQKYAASNATYSIEVTADESVEPQALSYPGRDNITVRLSGSGGEKIISLAGDRPLLTISSGATLILDNGITLRGQSSNTSSLVYVTGGTLIMNEGVKITGNGGGGVLAYGTFSMAGGEISGNAGRGVEGHLTMTGGKISGNAGGGVSATHGIFRMTDGEISGNGNTVSNGGGVFVPPDGFFSMEGGKIYGNTASKGGGVYVTLNFIWNGPFLSRLIGEFIMKGGEISGNTASAEGGGVYVYALLLEGKYQSAIFEMSGGKITGNRASAQGGGAHILGTFTMTDGEISGNSITTTTSPSLSLGGGVCVVHGTFTISDGNISGNTAASGGGVMVWNNGNFEMTGGKISGNNATANSGGGVYVANSGKFKMVTGAEISGNNASWGAGVYDAGNFDMSGGKISSNTGHSAGGGVVVIGTFRMFGGEISNNYVTYDGGGIYVGGEGIFRINNGTIYGSNEADADLRNRVSTTYGSGATLHIAEGGTAQRGIYADFGELGAMWTFLYSLSTTNNTIRVVGGNL
jgi:hypothetical protein